MATRGGGTEGDGLGQVSLLLAPMITSPNTAAVSYHGPTNGVAAWDGTETDAQAVFGGTGPWVLSNWTITVATAPGAGASWTFMLRVNEADSALTCQVTGTNLTGSDLTHSVTVNPGQRVGIKCTPSASPAPVSTTRTCSILKCTAQFTNQTPWLWSSSTSHTEAASSTVYFQPMGGGVNAVQAVASAPVPCDGVLSALYVDTEINLGVTPGMTVTLNKNGVDQALSVTINGAARAGSDLVNSVNVSAGDYLVWKVVTGAVGTPPRARFGCLFAPTTDGEQAYMFTGALPQSVTQYTAGQAGFSATESQRQTAPTLPVTMKKLFINCTAGAPSAGQTVAMAARLGAADTPVTFTITGTTAVGNDNVHSQAALATDLIDWRVTTGAGALVQFGWGCVLAIAQVPAAGGGGATERSLLGVGA